MQDSETALNSGDLTLANCCKKEYTSKMSTIAQHTYTESRLD